MATGDLKGSLRKLQAALRSLKYPNEVDYQGLARGDATCFLPIVSYAFTSFSAALAEHLVEHDIELTGKNDLCFIETIYKVLRDFFSYKPLLNKQQFLQYGFAERKISLLCDIIRFALEKHKQLTKGTKSVSQSRRRLPSHSDSKTIHSSPPKEIQRMPVQRVRHPQPFLSRPLVERHVSCTTPAQFSLSSDPPQSPQQRGEDEEEEGGAMATNIDTPQPAADIVCVPESMLRAVESGLQECMCKLEKQMSLLDTRLQALEKSMNGKIIIERSDWENLESRVLLLETRLALDSAQSPPRVSGVLNLPDSLELSRLTQETAIKGRMNTSTAVVRSPLELSTDSHIPASLHPHSEENIKERLERIANMMKDTSSLLKNIEPTI